MLKFWILWKDLNRLISYYPFNGNANDVKGNFIVRCIMQNSFPIEKGN